MIWENEKKLLENAYVSYKNNNLQESLDTLNNLLDEILLVDKTLDDFWTMTTKDVFKAVILNNFYKGKEITLNDLDYLINTEEEMKKNLEEFKINFENNSVIDFIDRIDPMPENTLKSTMDILRTCVGKKNIKSSDTTEIIECFCGNKFELNWSKIPATEKFLYVRCPHCGSELKRKNPIYQETTEETKKTYDALTIKGKIPNIFMGWNAVKARNPKLKGFFDETEEVAKKELIEAKDKASILGIKLSEYINNLKLDCNDERTQLIISYFGYVSVYDLNFVNDGTGLCEEMSLDNLILFRAVLMIYIISILDNISSMGIPFNLNCTFERKAYIEILYPMLYHYLPKLFNNLKEIKVFYKTN